MPERWTRRTKPENPTVVPKGAPEGGFWRKFGHFVPGTTRKWWVIDGWEYFSAVPKQPTFVEPTFAAMSAEAMEKNDGDE